MSAKIFSTQCLLCLLLGFTTANPASAQTYRVINLGSGSLNEIPAINLSGQVAFSLIDGSERRAWFYDGTAIHNLGTLGGMGASATGLNNAGQVVGYSTYDSREIDRAFIWTRAGGMLNLGALGGAPFSRANAINSFGRVAGISQFLGPLSQASHAFGWTAEAGIEDLGTLAGGSSANAINDAGVIAGYSSAANNEQHAFAWRRDWGMIDLGTLGGIGSYAVAVGAKGQVAGYSNVQEGNFHAFIWTRTGGMRDLGTAGGIDSFPLAMSPNAHIAGAINIASGYQHAMSWTYPRMVDLGTLGGPGSRALGVNTKGQVVGGAMTKKGQWHAFIWTAAQGMVDLNRHLQRPPKGLVLDMALAISDNGSIVASSNTGLVLLRPTTGSTLAPAVGPIEAVDLVASGTPVEASASFANENPAGTHSVSWSWGDGSVDTAGQVSERDGEGSASASHAYAAPGIYRIVAHVADGAGNSASSSRTVIVYDPSSGYAGGSGTFMSQQGANKRAPLHAGKAAFSFVAASGGRKPELRVSMVALDFRSENFVPVAVQGPQARFEGSGTINGRGDYRFSLVTASDGAVAPSRFGLRIWHVDPVTKAEVVDYDNHRGTEAGAAGPAVEGRIAVQL